MSLKEIRCSYNITQSQAAKISNMPLRTYIRYEEDEQYGNVLKRERITDLLKSNCEVTEDKGILTVETIKSKVKAVLQEYKNVVDFCYLFGSYAKGYAKDNSDVDLCIGTTLTGFKYVGLVESLRTALNKRVDLLRISDLKDDIKIVEEIMKDGIKIYG